MTDEPEFPLAGLDAERPLSPELRARLEAALLAAVAEGPPLPSPADEETLDAPRPLPEAVRLRLEAALLAEAAAAAVVTSLGERRARRRRPGVAVWSAVAAVALLFVAVAGLLGRNGGRSPNQVAIGGPSTTATGAPAPLPSGAGDSVPSPQGPPPVATTTAPAPRTPRATTPPAGPGTAGTAGPTTTNPPVTTATTGPAGPAPATMTTNPPPASDDPGPAPPYASGPTPAASSPQTAATPAGSGSGDQGSSGSQPPRAATPAKSPTGSPLRIGIIPGDAGEEAGFRAYVNLVNQSGGVRNHPIELVTVGPGAPAADTVATVNLSPQPVAGPGTIPGWAAGPLLETLSAPEADLTSGGPVFSFSGPPERQGDLAADAVFPDAASGKGKTAVIYAAIAPGPLHDTVPAAIKKVLAGRGVTVTIVFYDPAKNPPTPLNSTADAAFLSLDPSATKAWVAQAKTAGYHPALGIAGLYSLDDEALLPDLPEGTRVISPYVVPAGPEGDAIRSGAGGTAATVLGGWVDAKALAVAVWRTGATTPAALQSALDGLGGWSSGLAPPYETRPGTRSRTPEGVLLQVQSGAFTSDNTFRRDPH